MNLPTALALGLVFTALGYGVIPLALLGNFRLPAKGKWALGLLCVGSCVTALGVALAVISDSSFLGFSALGWAVAYIAVQGGGLWSFNIYMTVYYWRQR